MLKRRAVLLTRGFAFLDISAIVVAFVASWFARSRPLGLTPESVFAVVGKNILLLAAYVLVWYLSAVRRDLYSSKRTTTLTREILDVLQITALCVVVVLIIPRALFVIRSEVVNREFIYLFSGLSFGFQMGIRILIRNLLRVLRRHGFNIRRVLIVGSNRRSLRLVRKIQDNPNFGLQPIGYIDDPGGISQDFLKEALPHLGQLDDLQKVLETTIVDEVFVTLPIKSYYGKIAKIVGICEEVGVEVRLLSDLFALKLARDSVSELGDISLLHFTTLPVDPIGMFVKRNVDLIVSLVGLMFLSPLLAIVAILIKLTSRGPVFFRQERVGYHQRKFTLLKFRSMYENAEEMKAQLLHLSEVPGPVFKMKNDPRVTRVGKFLRKYSIDELPQLINVFRGDMSLVGPRPPLSSEVKKYNWWQKRRLSVRPGITCLWQVRGRSHTTFDRWVDLDLEYIDNWSLKLDFRILLETLPAVLRAKGAY